MLGLACFVLAAWASLAAVVPLWWPEIAAAAARRGVPLEILRIADPELAKIYQAKLVLVRPDQHVCCRGNAEGDSDQAEYLFMRALGWRSAGAPKQPTAIAS